MATTRSNRRATQTASGTATATAREPKVIKLKPIKNTATKKKTSKTTKKAPLVAIKGVDLEYDKIKEVIKLLFDQKRVNAVELLRGYSGVDASKAIELLTNFWNNDFAKLCKDAKIVEEFMPEKCCANCIGPCGNKKSIMKSSLFIPSENAFRGHNCPRFMTEEMFLGRGNRVMRLRKENLRKSFEFIIDEPFVSIKYGKDQVIRRSKDREIVKYLIADKCKLLKSMTRLMVAGWNMENDSDSKRSLRVFNEEPKKGETYNQYMERAQAGYRKSRTDARDKIKKLSKTDVAKLVLDIFKENGLDETLRDTYGNNLDNMLHDFYPEKTIYEIAIGLTLK